ncbi:MAG TPA: prenyltransferase/squalene oxidase repeat-containing protein [Roseiflexaceae bacterium]|nr:prenyltransferase/squalene oxidase repeat-containing protein [Roseiflexaceae bacterium]
MEATAQQAIADSILVAIRDIAHDLGRSGGWISASEYDTAQVLRLAPPEDGRAVLSALTWLLKRQHSDGGFGDPFAPQLRGMVSLAVALCFHHYCVHFSHLTDARDRALAFVRRNTGYAVTDDIAIGAELIMPRLLDEARALGLELPQAPYAALLALGQRRRALIADTHPGAGTTAAHSWEAWGSAPDPALIDVSGGVGHSPAATAAWLNSASDRADLLLYRQRVQAYLARASTATASGVAGLFPTVWPNDRFEQIFSLFAMSCAGLLRHPLLRETLAPQIRDLAQSIQPAGLSFSSCFTPDGDDTATAMILLAQAGHLPPPQLLAPFDRGEHFATWPGEMHMSLSTTAHALHALALLGQPIDLPLAGLIRRQQPEGCWSGDKWHSSAFYTTGQAMLALREAGQLGPLRSALRWLVARQHPCGGWGHSVPTILDTAYSVLALRPFVDVPGVRQAIRRSQNLLLSSISEPLYYNGPARWIGKTLYRHHYVDRMFELCAAWSVLTS